jgi:hypothetical protein
MIVVGVARMAYFLKMALPMSVSVSARKRTKFLSWKAWNLGFS